MQTPPAAQGAPPWSPSFGDATSSASASPSCSSDPSSSSPPTSSSGPSSPPPQAAPSSSGCRGTTPPPSSCAACRHQRRKCPPDCLLNRYFVADDEPDRFRNALRVFGVKNMQRMLRAVPPPRRDVCVQTIVYESNLRAADPVRGCCGVIQDLENQLMDTAVELEVLRRRLESYRQMARGSGSNPMPIQQRLMARTSDDIQTQGQDGVPPAANELAVTRTQLSATEMEPQLSQVQRSSPRCRHDSGRCSHMSPRPQRCHESPRCSRSGSQRYSENRQMRRQTVREARTVIWLEKS